MKKYHARATESEACGASATLVPSATMFARTTSHWIRWGILVAFLVSVVEALANTSGDSALNIRDDFTELSLTRHLLLLKDPAGQLTIEDIKYGNHGSGSL